MNNTVYSVLDTVKGVTSDKNWFKAEFRFSLPFHASLSHCINITGFAFKSDLVFETAWHFKQVNLSCKKVTGTGLSHSSVSSQN